MFQRGDSMRPLDHSADRVHCRSARSGGLPFRIRHPLEQAVEVVLPEKAVIVHRMANGRDLPGIDPIAERVRRNSQTFGGFGYAEVVPQFFHFGAPRHMRTSGDGRPEAPNLTKVRYAFQRPGDMRYAISEEPAWPAYFLGNGAMAVLNLHAPTAVCCGSVVTSASMSLCMNWSTNLRRIIVARSRRSLSLHARLGRKRPPS